MNNMKTITIPQEEYDQLIKDQNMLIALQGAGVDNWEGYDAAMEYFNEME